jgi:hypothetical protein
MWYRFFWEKLWKIIYREPYLPQPGARRPTFGWSAKVIWMPNRRLDSDGFRENRPRKVDPCDPWRTKSTTRSDFRFGAKWPRFLSPGPIKISRSSVTGVSVEIAIESDGQDLSQPRGPLEQKRSRWRTLNSFTLSVFGVAEGAGYFALETVRIGRQITKLLTKTCHWYFFSVFELFRFFEPESGRGRPLATPTFTFLNFWENISFLVFQTLKFSKVGVADPWLCPLSLFWTFGKI